MACLWHFGMMEIATTRHKSTKSFRGYFMCLMSKNTQLGLTVASIIFGLVAVLHASRLLMHFSVTFNGQEVPLIANVIGLLITAYLSIWMWTLRSS